jgi:hypothetical protein
LWSAVDPPAVVCLMADGRLELPTVVREGLQDVDSAVEVHDFREIFLAQTPRESHGGFLRRVQPFFHARARVEQERKRDR